MKKEKIYAITSFKGKYDFLSNFYQTPIKYEDIEFPSSEHAYQAAKTLDKKERERIAKISSPAIAKKEAKKLKIRSDWESVKKDIMFDILKIKFSNRELQEDLLRTENAILIEGNWWADTYWGCIVKHEHELSGDNTLGELLMKVRDYYHPNSDFVY